MKHQPHMTLLIRGWLAASRIFAFAIAAFAKRMHAKQGISSERFGERQGTARAPRAKGRWVWIHAASLGEVGQIAGLVSALQDSHRVNVLVTTVTKSGAHWVEQSLPGVVHQYLPLDTPAAVRGFLDHWQPDLGVFIEADIWPRLVLETASRQIPLALLNARPSKTRDRAPKSSCYLLSKFSAVTCKSREVLDGLHALGVAPDKVHSFGDLRASVPALTVDPQALVTLQNAVAGRPVWIAASSHADDEAEILIACHHVLGQHPQALLIWAPRHPERADAIMQAAIDLEVHQRSMSETITNKTQIYLADTLGELGTLFSLSDIVFLGGSFGAEGGHNPFEPAHFGCFVLTGPKVQNHKAAFGDLTQTGAAITVQDGAQLGEQVLRVLEAGDAATKGAQARALVAQADGAVDKTVALLVAQLSS